MLERRSDSNPIIEPAHNAPGSVVIGDFRLSLEHDRSEYEFWEGAVFPLIRAQAICGDTAVGILDLGCGTGAKAEALLTEARNYGLDTTLVAMDLVPDNVAKTRQRMAHHGVSSDNIVEGNVTEGLPAGKFDMISAFELIHWLTPEEIVQLFTNVSERLNEQGAFVLSFATKWNNAMLRLKSGELRVNKDTRDERLKRDLTDDQPIHQWSDVCNTRMTFPTEKFLSELGRKSGLRTAYYREVPNPYFPTWDSLNFRTYGMSRENANMIFFK